MAFSDKFINNYKKGVDVAGLVNEFDIQNLTNTSLQHKCLFEILIYPQTFPTSLPGVLLAGMELAIMRTYLYSIEEVILTGFEYQRTGGIQWVKDIIYPESVTFGFLETGLGVIKNYLQTWMDTVATYQKTTIGGKLVGDYYFKDNQNESKRNAIIIPLQTDMLPSLQWIMIEGLKFKTVTNIGYDQANGENEIISVQFACDSVVISGAI